MMIDDHDDNAVEAEQRTSTWLRWIGLRRRIEPKRLKLVPLVPTRWGWSVIVITLFIGGSAGFMEYSMQPDFCRSCHIMEPYYQAWHDSTHKDVPCADCHFEPGWKNTLKGKWQASSQAAKYITQTYGSKPHAEIRDASCMRSGCHEQRLLEGAVRWEVPTERGGTVTIKFDHTPHLKPDRRGKQLRCVSCHSQMVQGQHIVVTLDTCFLCHMKGFEHGRHEDTLGGCTSCHDAPKEQIRLATGMFNHSQYIEQGATCENCHSEVIKGSGEVPRQVCWTCHNQPKHIAKYDDSVKMHEIHVSKHKVECSSCHVQIEHSLTAALPGGGRKHGIGQMLQDNGSCGQCHEQSHAGPAELYRGTGGRGVPDMPAPMFRAQVDCIACHNTMKQSDSIAAVVGQTFVGSQKSCDHCHGTKYDTVLEEWKATIASHLDRAEVAYAEAEAALAGAKLSGVEELGARRLLDDASHNIRLVKLGRGVHNVHYSTALLNAAIQRCTEVTDIAGPNKDPAMQETAEATL
jgi:nitrate/TMAO reductase-like tetraheme cytochrome c subunit